MGRPGPEKISIQDRATGNEVLSAVLAGPDHGGGVAIDGDHVWVTSSDGYVYLYSLAEIQAANGATVRPQTRFAVPASAFLNAHGGRLYVVYESGASAYQYDGNDPGDHITITPLDALK